MIILETRNEGIRFTSSHLQSISKEYMQIMQQYNCTQESLLKEILVIVGKNNTCKFHCTADFFIVMIPFLQLDMLIPFAAWDSTLHSWMSFAGLCCNV